MKKEKNMTQEDGKASREILVIGLVAIALAMGVAWVVVH